MINNLHSQYIYSVILETQTLALQPKRAFLIFFYFYAQYLASSLQEQKR